MTSRFLLAIVVGALTGAGTRAEFPKPATSESSKPYASVEIVALTYRDPRPLRVWAVRIDLTSPDLDFAVTPRGKVSKLETIGQTTLEFAKSIGMQLAINATPFGPIPRKPGEEVDVHGLDIADGILVSPPQDGFAALTIDEQGRPSIHPSPVKSEHVKNARHGVGGFSVVLSGGKNLYPNEKDNPKAALHPRTAVGLTDDKSTMIWIIVDGRQKGKSEGVNLYELAELGASLGCREVLNLDGGGSTTLVLQDPKSREHRIINAPSGLLPRFNGNNLGLRVFAAGRDLTAAQLTAIMPTLTPERVRTFLGPLNRVMDKYEITTPLRRAAFLAQLAHESGEFKYMEEIASGEAYEGRANLGNTQPGDGKRYKGRGPIQLTGRSNYRKAGEALGIDLENNPEIAARPSVGCLVAGWYWNNRKINEPADAKDFTTVTRRINGGLNGQPKREKYYQRALEVLRD